MKKIFQLELGTTVKEIFTGFTGVIMARTDHITGCVQYGILPKKLDKEGEMRGWAWLDEDRLKVVRRPAKKRASSSVGGPCPTAPSK